MVSIGVHQAFDIAFVNVSSVHPIYVVEGLPKGNCEGSADVHSYSFHEEFVIQALSHYTFEHALGFVAQIRVALPLFHFVSLADVQGQDHVAEFPKAKTAVFVRVIAGEKKLDIVLIYPDVQTVETKLKFVQRELILSVACEGRKSCTKVEIMPVG